MIDLTQLAESRAHDLGQSEKPWIDSAWSADFQRLSQSLSDGEIEQFFQSCGSVEEFRVMTSLLIETIHSQGITFGDILSKVSRTGFLLNEWFDSIVVAKRWADAQFLAISFFEILMFVNACALKATSEERPLLEEVQDGLKLHKLGKH
jgi:hypothetical protein